MLWRGLKLLSLYDCTTSAPLHPLPTPCAGIPGVYHHVRHQFCTGGSLMSLPSLGFTMATRGFLCLCLLLSSSHCWHHSSEPLSAGLLPAWHMILPHVILPTAQVTVALYTPEPAEYPFSPVSSWLGHLPSGSLSESFQNSVFRVLAVYYFLSLENFNLQGKQSSLLNLLLWLLHPASAHRLGILFQGLSKNTMLSLFWSNQNKTDHDKSNLRKEGRVSSGSQFEGTICHSRKATAAGMWGQWSQCIYSHRVKRECYTQIAFCFITWSRGPSL